MNYCEAVKLLKDGKAIKAFIPGFKDYICLDSDGGIRIVNDYESVPQALYMNALNRNDWQIEEKIEYFDFKEAIKRMRNCKRVVRKADCNKFKYIFYDCGYKVRNNHDMCNYAQFEIADVDCVDWYEVK